MTKKDIRPRAHFLLPDFRVAIWERPGGHPVLTNGEICWTSIGGTERTVLEVREALHWLSSNRISSFELVTV